MKTIILLATLILFLPVACSSSNPSNVTVLGVKYSEAQIERGELTYQQYCASCHGKNGEGQRPDLPPGPDETGLIPAPPHNDSGHTWHHADSILIDIITNGGLGDPSAFYPMPAFSDQLSSEQIRLVLAYIKTMWTQQQRGQQAMISG
jgi:mono/diheme cytochrome c family protein